VDVARLEIDITNANSSVVTSIADVNSTALPNKEGNGHSWLHGGA
jgi:hypothetical protein